MRLGSIQVDFWWFDVRIANLFIHRLLKTASSPLLDVFSDALFQLTDPPHLLRVSTFLSSVCLLPPFCFYCFYNCFSNLEYLYFAVDIVHKKWCEKCARVKSFTSKWLKFASVPCYTSFLVEIHKSIGRNLTFAWQNSRKLFTKLSQIKWKKLFSLFKGTYETN